MKHISELLDEWKKELFEERSAIREFDGRQTREQAERAAAVEVEGWKKSHQGTEIQP